MKARAAWKLNIICGIRSHHYRGAIWYRGRDELGGHRVLSIRGPPHEGKVANADIEVWLRRYRGFPNFGICVDPYGGDEMTML